MEQSNQEQEPRYLLFIILFIIIVFFVLISAGLTHAQVVWEAESVATLDKDSEMWGDWVYDNIDIALYPSYIIISSRVLNKHIELTDTFPNTKEHIYERWDVYYGIDLESKYHVELDCRTIFHTEEKVKPKYMNIFLTTPTDMYQFRVNYE